MPSSVVWVTLTTCGWARCTSSKPRASMSTSSGVSLPSGVRTGSSLRPPIFSGAPHSSRWMCAVDVQTTDAHRDVIACSATTFAPVPLNTGYAAACGPKCPRKTSCRCSV